MELYEKIEDVYVRASASTAESFGDGTEPLTEFEECLKSDDAKYTTEPMGRHELVK